VLKTTQFIGQVFVTNKERVNYVRGITAEFEERQPRGYAATGCLIEPRGDQNVIAFNDIPTAVVTDYSSTPRGVERAAKFAALGHAEVNAISFCAQNGIVTKGAIMTLAWFPCINCAAAIVQAGIGRLVATEPNYDYKPEQYDFRGALRVLEDAGVVVCFEK